MDLQMLLESGKVYIHRRIDELFVKDALTHETVAVYRTSGNSYIVYDKVQAPTGEITWHDPTKDISTKDLVETNTIPFSEYTVHRLLERMAEGEALTKICKDDSMPSYSQLMRWQKLHPWIRLAIEDARLARAEYHRDKVLEEADKAESWKDPINATQVKIDAHKWAAGVDDAKYKNNAKIEATINVPTQILVNTGIVRDVVEKTPEEVSDAQNKNPQTITGDSTREMLGASDKDKALGD